ncbi:MAG: hypothetical protein KAU23_08955 [Anaerolineales bacterium]|nr:hypothetical protein [Anaerolineales bacterium]
MKNRLFFRMQAVFLSKNKQVLAKTLSPRKMLPIRELLIRYLKGKKSPCKAEHYAIIKFQVKNKTHPLEIVDGF